MVAESRRVPSTNNPSKRVSPQHTLERVRNNQRQHRARRRAYIAALETKLSEAEQTISTLEGKIKILEAELAASRSHMCPGLEHEVATNMAHVAAASDVLVTAHVDSKSSQGIAGQLTAADLIAIPTPQHVPDLASSTVPECEPATMVGALESIAALPGQGLDVLGSESCCTSRSSSIPSSNASAADQMAIIPRLDYSLALPEYVFHPGMEGFFESGPDSDSTILCSEASLLISQQNFKGVGPDDVAAWLWSGFRKALQPGQGCRVKTDTLFSLLAFISEI